MSTFKALNGSTTSPKAETQAVPATSDSPSASETPKIAPAEQPGSAITSPVQANADASGNARESWPTQGPDRPVANASAGSETESSNKRKRSESVEAIAVDGATQEKSPASAHPAKSTEQESYATPQREYKQFSDQRDSESWYSRRDGREDPDSQQKATSPTNDQHDEPGSDPSRRRAESEYSNTSAEADDRAPGYGNNYSGEPRGDGILQHDPKKRKRNFSNRTKTGCLTCRKRKKKCDEQKPECNNCIRGGFVCAGYPPQRGAWPSKLENKSTAVPLESKDPSYIPPGAYGMPQPGMYGAQPLKREPLPHYRGQPLRIDPPQGRPLMTDDDRHTASTLASASVASPDHKLSTVPFTPANAFPTPVSANTQPPLFDRMGKEYHRVPPLHELSRGDHGRGDHGRGDHGRVDHGRVDRNRVEHVRPEHPRNEHSDRLPQISLLHSGRTNSPNRHPSMGPTSNPQVAAQMALAHPQYPQRRTQKEEMLSGRHFYAFDKELCLERERCATACWRFNNLTAPPTNGVSPDERARLFLEILQPRDPVRVSPAEASPVTNVGRVGRHVAVETPFNSDYGYNISIGHHVVIGRNCTINDVCEVRIGDNCVIGPNVSIYTANLPIDPKKRQGGQGPQYGRPVVIEQDCWIGGGATILPGRTIGKGSTVGAGSIVTKDVPPFTVVAGNPARVLRGIAS